MHTTPQHDVNNIFNATYIIIIMTNSVGLVVVVMLQSVSGMPYLEHEDENTLLHSYAITV